MAADVNKRQPKSETLDLRRVVIENVTPEVDGGRFPIKRVTGERVVVEADIFCDGHDSLSCVLLHRKAGGKAWREAPMTHLGNDRWRGEFAVTDLGRHEYMVQGWVDPYLTWSLDLRKRVEAGQDIRVDLLIGAKIVWEAAERATGKDKADLEHLSAALMGEGDTDDLASMAWDPGLVALARKHADRSKATLYDRPLTVVVDREKARFSAWYEMFPRSASHDPSRHGTFEDVERLLPYIADMGFDVLYLPPIHPVGYSYRKGKNNTLVADATDVGSPWAIGSSEGGHKEVHPELGTVEDFRHLVHAAKQHGIEIALDVALQASPDHPYVQEHPEWFRQRPDGTVQYAENPPKKYQDIYPFDFESRDAKGLWKEVCSIFDYWADQGVRIFRVDNPHTKPFNFWEWTIAEVKRKRPDVLFLSEAFTRPKVMHRLAKLGFTQSYTYFTWRNSKWELTEYFQQLAHSPSREYFVPSVWPNTPDILHAYLQTGGQPAFIVRLVLAATLAANYGIYGPAFELKESAPREPGSEEYLNSEKYEVKAWDIHRPDSLKDLIARINRIRRENVALHSDWSLKFHPVDNERLLCYSKSSHDLSNIILGVVNLDPHHRQSGWVDLPLQDLGLEPDIPYQVHDLLSDARFIWHGARNYVELDPYVVPAHIFLVRRQAGTEREFSYYV